MEHAALTKIWHVEFNSRRRIYLYVLCDLINRDTTIHVPGSAPAGSYSRGFRAEKVSRGKERKELKKKEIEVCAPPGNADDDVNLTRRAETTVESKEANPRRRSSVRKATIREENSNRSLVAFVSALH